MSGSSSEKPSVAQRRSLSALFWGEQWLSIDWWVEETRRFTVRKKTEPLRQLERQQRPEQRRGSAQAVAPHDAMRLSVIDGKTLSASDLLFMQRAIGNRQVQRFLAHHNKYRSDLPHAATNEEEYARADKKTHVSLCRQQRPLKIGQRVPALLQRTC